MSEKPSCPNCGNSLRPDAPYCPVCGEGAQANSGPASNWPLILLLGAGLPIGVIGGCSLLMLGNLGAVHLPTVFVCGTVLVALLLIWQLKRTRGSDDS
jgi:hypothetical protein